MNPIKVLHIISVDKQNYYLKNLKENSDSDRIEYSFVTLAPENCDFVTDFRKKGWQVYGLDALKRKSYPRAIFQLSKLFKSIDPDIVHTHLFDASLLGLTVAKMQRRKTVLTRHHSDAIHEITSVVKRRFYLALEKYVSHLSDRIIAPSKMVRDFLVEKEGVTDDKVKIIPYGQTTERFDAITGDKIAAIRNELGMNGQLSIVNVSRLYRRKGHKYLFEAFSSLIRDGLNAKLYLVGDGDFRSELETMCINLGIADNVNFVGWRDDALAIIAAADIIVHPSLEDALSSAVIESVMLEKPIVATDISGVRDSLGDGKYGLIVPPADAASLHKALKETIENFDDATQRSREGRKYLLEYMSAKRVAAEYEACYAGLVQKADEHSSRR